MLCNGNVGIILKLPFAQLRFRLFNCIMILSADTTYLGNLYAEADDKLYRAEADGFAWGIDEDSIKIWKQQGDNRYVVTSKDQSETVSDMIFVIRKVENKDNKNGCGQITDVGKYDDASAQITGGEGYVRIRDDRYTAEKIL